MSNASFVVRSLHALAARVAATAFFSGLLVFAAACTGDKKAPDDAPEGAISRDADDLRLKTPQPAAPPSACEAVSVDVLKETTGLDGSGKPAEIGGADACTWTDDSGKKVVLQLYPSASRYEQARTAFEELQGQSSQDLENVGDQAFFVGGKTNDAQAAAVTVRKGQNALSVQVMSPDGKPEGLKEEAITLAKKVADSL